MGRSDAEKRLRGVLTFQGLEKPSYAVVIPLVPEPDGPKLLIEVRAMGIPQAGDPCFPGGRIEPNETQAASRELFEELGIRTDPEAFLGQLPTVRTILGSRTDVFVCVVPASEAGKLSLNRSEVSELLRVPMSFFLARPDAESYPVSGHVIWGMTAGAIRHFCDAWKRAGLGDGGKGSWEA